MISKRTVAALILPAVVAGCASANVGVRTGGSTAARSSTPPPGSSYSAASIQAHGSPNAYVGTILFVPVLFGIGDEYRQMRGGPSWRKAPEMAEGRVIVERDCSKPLGEFEGNLRCK